MARSTLMTGRPALARARDAELRRLAGEVTGLLVTIVGRAYHLRVALPSGSDQRDAAQIEWAGQRAAALVADVARVIDPLADDPPAGSE